ncbi:MAG: DUF5791 family protein [Natrialbaceae archaeon]|nr:DUF5791 family protein [Natrialbaceae archaeon]
MIFEQRLSVPGTPETLLDEYRRALAAIVEEVGLEAAAEETDTEVATLRTLVNGDSPTLSLEQAAAIQALEDGQPDAETLAQVATETLLLGMSSAVLDVETLASELPIDLEPKEIQQRLERRAPMTLAEYAHLEHTIVERMP